MRHTNDVARWASRFLVGAVCLGFLISDCSATEAVKLRKTLTADETRCLRELFHEHYVHYPQESDINALIAETSVGQADLKGNGNRAFIFVIEDIGYCGTAGCLMLVGERRLDGKCHTIAAASADGGEVMVASRRDHGYHRLYAPCELYYDGRQYQQVREECPNAVIHR